MINLLPPAQKDDLRREQTLKITISLGIAASCAFFSCLLLLVFAKNYYDSQLEIKLIEAREREANLAMLDGGQGGEKIKEYNKIFSKLKVFYARQNSAADLFEKLAAAVPETVFLSSSNISSGKVAITGYSGSRDALMVLKTNLEKTPEFKNVVFPPNTWISPKDIFFTVNFEYEPKK